MFLGRGIFGLVCSVFQIDMHYQHIATEHEIEEYTIGIMVTKRFLLGTR